MFSVEIGGGTRLLSCLLEVPPLGANQVAYWKSPHRGQTQLPLGSPPIGGKPSCLSEVPLWGHQPEGPF